MDEKVAIVKKIIYRPYLDSIDRIVYFCEKCNQNAEGSKAGLLANLDVSCQFDDADNIAKDFINFCPTCGKLLNWNNIICKTSRMNK